MSEVKGTADLKVQTDLRGVLPAGIALPGCELQSILGRRLTLESRHA